MFASIVSGMALGAVYALVAVGYNLTWLTGKAINFAQAGFAVAGMFLAVWCYGQGLSPVAVFAILVAAGGLVATVEYVVALRPLRGRGEHAELITTLGFSTIIQGVILLFVSDDALRVPFFGPEQLIDVPGGRIAPVELVLVAVAVVVGLGAHLWATRTRSGLAALAQSEDRDAALVLGIRPERISFVVFVVSGVLGSVMAPLAGPKTFAAVALVSLLAIKGFVVLALGGVGSLLGALVGGLAIGVVEAVVVRLTDAAFQNIAVFGIFIVTLLVRPRGLFGERKERYV